MGHITYLLTYLLIRCVCVDEASIRQIGSQTARKRGEKATKRVDKQRRNKERQNRDMEETTVAADRRWQ